MRAAVASGWDAQQRLTNWKRLDTALAAIEGFHLVSLAIITSVSTLP
jgi:hypothetical protein